MNILLKKVINIIPVPVLLLTACTKEVNKPEPVSDFEGNTYKTVQINDQVWMAENLKSTKYNDGSEIPLVSGSVNWNNLTTDGFCWYDNDAQTFSDVYGALYNGYTIMKGNLCPVGWHIPSKDEWSKLRDFLGDSTIAGSKLKEAGTDHWQTPNKGADNSTGFTALGAGIRYFEGTFSSNQSYIGFWSSTEMSPSNVWSTNLYYGDDTFGINLRSKKYGFSVRCIKDQP